MLHFGGPSMYPARHKYLCSGCQQSKQNETVFKAAGGEGTRGVGWGRVGGTGGGIGQCPLFNVNTCCDRDITYFLYGSALEEHHQLIWTKYTSIG